MIWGRCDAGELGLAHLLATDQQPAVPEDLLRDLEARGHQHGGPDDGVEAQDVLAHDVRRRPAAGELLIVGAVADGRDVVEQGVEPHVDDVRLVPRDLDAPVERGAGDGEVGQARLDEREHLVPPALGLHEVGALLVERDQAVGERAHPEEVVALVEQFDRLGVDRADLLALVLALAVHELARLLELLAADAVVALVLARVDVSGVVEVLQELLHVRLVAGIGGADEVVVGEVDGLEQRLPRLGDELVGPLLRRDAVRRGRAEDLLPVLIGTGEHPGVFAALAVPACDDVGGDLRVRVPDVRHIVHVEDRRGDVEGRAAGHADHPIRRAEPFPPRYRATMRP